MKQAIPKNQKLYVVFFVSALFSAIAWCNPALSKDLNNHKRIDKPVIKRDTSTNYTLLILDDNEAPIVNAKIKIKGSNKVVVTKAGGQAELKAQSGDVVQIIIGKTIITEFTLGKDLSPTLLLSSKSVALKEARNVRLLYNTSIPSNLTAASTEAIYTNDLVKMPVTSVKSALAGRFAGLSTSQASGQPGNDELSIRLHGVDPLVVIDGVPRPITTIDLDEIESVTLLKDALSTAMFGIKGSNGVLLITTRQGSPSKQRISFTAQTATQKALKTPSALGAFDYATLRNEAVANEALAGNNYSSLLYSAADLQAYKDGSDPTGHPDVNWRDLLFKQSARLNRYSLNVSGGSKDARYFVAVENLKQTGFLNTLSTNNYNTNNELNSYLIRSNIDINITPKLIAGVHLFGRIINSNEPAATQVGSVSPAVSTGVAGIYSALLTTPNNAYPQFNPDGSYGGSQQYQNNLWAQAIGSGYLQSYRRDILADFSLKRTLDEVTPGLWVKGLGSFSSNIIENIIRSKPFVTYKYNAPAVQGATPTYTQFGTTGVQVDNNNIGTQARQSYFELSLGYSRTFNDVHGFNVVLLANSDNSVNGSALPYTVMGTSGRISYNYKQKYVAEVAYGLNGSNYYRTNGSAVYGFFPAFGLAWNIDQENFLKDNTWISSLKLFSSYGKTGNDIASYFPGIQRYNGTTAYFGTAAGASAGLAEGTLANPNLSYEKAEKLNVGLQGGLFNNKLGFTVEYYNNRYHELLIQRGKSTSTIGVAYPLENIGINRYYGWDLQLKWQQTVNSGFSYYVGGVAGIQQSKVVFTDEVNQPYAYMYRTGQKVGQAFGYNALGLIQTASEAASVPTFVGYTPQPGDIKYLDVNKDGVINQLDQTPIGPTKPAINLGFNLGFTFKSFDFSALIQGALNRNVYLSGNGYWEFQNSGYGQAYQQQLNRWTPATAATATYPRLSIGNNTNNNIFSTYWFRAADYARLKNIEAGFTLPAQYAGRIGIKSIRVFASGTNLFTLTKLKDADPEVSDGSYPIQKLFNLGINIKL